MLLLQKFVLRLFAATEQVPRQNAIKVILPSLFLFFLSLSRAVRGKSRSDRKRSKLLYYHFVEAPALSLRKDVVRTSAKAAARFPSF
jgi:hypothetical protein